MLFLSSASFLKSTVWKNYFNNSFRVSNSLDPDQARQNVGPDPSPNCQKPSDQFSKYGIRFGKNYGYSVLIRANIVNAGFLDPLWLSLLGSKWVELSYCPWHSGPLA